MKHISWVLVVILSLLVGGLGYKNKELSTKQALLTQKLASLQGKLDRHAVKTKRSKQSKRAARDKSYESQSLARNDAPAEAAVADAVAKGIYPPREPVAVANLPQATEADDAIDDEIEARAEEIAEDIIQERREERWDRRRKRMKDRIAETAEELGWSEQLQQSVSNKMGDFHKQHRGIRDEVDAGNLTHEEAREEHMRVREEGKVEMEKLIGADALEVLREKMWGPRRK